MIGGTEIIVTTDLALGFGIAGAGLIAILLIAGGGYASLKTMKKKRSVRTRIAGMIGVVMGAYIVIDIALNFPVSFLAQGLVNGFGADAIAYQKAIPLMIMVFALLVLPKGLVSIQWRRILRRERRN